MLKARFTESKIYRKQVGYARLTPPRPKQIQAKTFAWMTRKQRKVLEIDFLFKRDIF